MEEYTEKDHAENLIKMMESVHVGEACPAAKYFNFDYDFSPKCTSFNRSPCNICRNFVGVWNTLCPCCFFASSEEAVKQTWISLEEKGYI